jgi:hypothetical protein
MVPGILNRLKVKDQSQLPVLCAVALLLERAEAKRRGELGAMRNEQDDDIDERSSEATSRCGPAMRRVLRATEKGNSTRGIILYRLL